MKRMEMNHKNLMRLNRAKEMLREMNKGGDEKKSGISEAERDEMIEEEEAKTRQIYDPAGRYLMIGSAE